MDEDVIQAGRRVAREQKASIFSLFGRFIRLLDRRQRMARLGPLTRQASGLLNLPEDVSEKDLLAEARATR